MNWEFQGDCLWGGSMTAENEEKWCDIGSTRNWGDVVGINCWL